MATPNIIELQEFSVGCSSSLDKDAALDIIEQENNFTPLTGPNITSLNIFVPSDIASTCTLSLYGDSECGETQDASSEDGPIQIGLLMPSGTDLTGCFVLQDPSRPDFTTQSAQLRC
ncbi:hypothetical protein B7463_g1291, partial [Scytalidium lignicola]